jgi:hypothetical protein
MQVTLISGGAIRKQEPQRFATIRGKKVPLSAKKTGKKGNLAGAKREVDAAWGAYHTALEGSVDQNAKWAAYQTAVQRYGRIRDGK